MDLMQQAATAMAMAGAEAGTLRAAVTQAAVQIMAESTDQPNHEARVKLAMRVLRDPGSVTDTFAWAVSTNPSVVDKWSGDDPTSAWGDVPYVLSTVWDALSLSWAEIL